MGKNLWDKKNSFTYIKVGAFFFVAIILFFIAALFIKKEVNIFKGTYLIIVKFEFAEGLRQCSPVRFCGVNVGEVKKVAIKGEGQKHLVYVYVKIRKGVRIPKDSYFFINSLSLFGEKYLEINPPASVAAYMSDGEIAEGVSPVPLFSIFKSLVNTMGELRNFVQQGKVKTSLENTLINLEGVSLGLKELIEDVRDKKGTIGRLFYDDSLYTTTEEFIEDLKQHPWKLLNKPKETKKKEK